jgi:hypothetical protein
MSDRHVARSTIDELLCRKSTEQANAYLDSTRELRQENEYLHRLIAEIVASNGGTLRVRQDFIHRDGLYTSREDKDNRCWILTTDEPAMTEQRYTREQYAEFRQLVLLAESIRQMDRIEARLQQPKFIARVGQDVCDLMFEELKKEQP